MQLKPCPKCNSNNLYRDLTWFRQPRWWAIKCKECGFIGPEACDENHNKPSETELWNNCYAK